MKHIYILIFFALFAVFESAAQNNGIPAANFFDPERDPIAVRSDTSTVLVVSEYVLTKALKARMGRGCQVQKMYQKRQRDGADYLFFEVVYANIDGRQALVMALPLIPDAQRHFFFAGQQALVCKKEGCASCDLVNGQCMGCCALTNGRMANPPIQVPLLKVQTTIDD
jgi:hypothetical protein